MDFGVLFLDFSVQARHSYCAVIPGIIRGMVRGSNESLMETDNIPMPVTLGDFVKLRACPSPASPKHASDVVLEIYYGFCTSESNDMARTLTLLRNSMSFSLGHWSLASRGELAWYGLTWYCR